jgi:hypothetical protein
MTPSNESLTPGSAFSSASRLTSLGPAWLSSGRSAGRVVAHESHELHEYQDAVDLAATATRSHSWDFWALSPARIRGTIPVSPGLVMATMIAEPAGCTEPGERVMIAFLRSWRRVGEPGR